MLNTTVVIGGEPGLVTRIDGTASLFTTIDGETAQYIGGAVQLEDEIEVTPTQSTQMIEPSEGYVGLKAVKVNPIPSNYGLITWNGAVLTIS